MFIILLACLVGVLALIGLRFLPSRRLVLSAAIRRAFGARAWRRPVLGAALACGIAAVAFGVDPSVLAGTSMPPGHTQIHADGLPVEGVLPTLDGADTWLNSPPLTTQSLKGKVVLVDFWTYSCINCLHTLPYIKTWAQKYKDQGLVVIGVHAPEFAFEHDVGNVKKAIRDLKIDYPVAIDNHFTIWRALNNSYWPALYFVDAQGQIRHHQFGEGGYAESEKVIQQLLAEAGHGAASGAADGADGGTRAGVPTGTSASTGTATNAASGTAIVATAGTPKPLDPTQAQGVEMAPDEQDLASPETYIGYEHADNFSSPGGQVRDRTNTYAAPSHPSVNDWGLAGAWTIGAEYATLAAPAGGIVYRFHARDVHLVLGPGASGKPVRFQVTLDGAPPKDAHGSDVDAQGYGVIEEQRLYQLVRQSGDVRDHTFAIRFLEPGVQAYAFTFG